MSSEPSRGVDDDPNTRRWQSAAEHVAAYRGSDGEIGHTWHDRPHLLLTTTGRRSGQEHTVPLVYARLPGWGSQRLVVAASAGGAERHPAWYLNLVEAQEVGVQLMATRWRTPARTAAGAEVEAGWAALGAVWAGFTRYREGTRRDIPLVLLDGGG